MKKLLIFSLLVTLFVAIGTVAKARDDYAARSSPKIEIKKDYPVIIQSEVTSPVIIQMEAPDIGEQPVINYQANPPGEKSYYLTNINRKHPDIDERLCTNTFFDSPQFTERHLLKIRPVKRE